MSDIVEMTGTVGPYEEGEVYRVRSRNAQQFVAEDAAVLTGDTKTESENEGV